MELYKKALLADDYDTAAILDLAGILPEELQKAREEVFSEKLGKINIVYNFAKDVARMIHTLQAKLNLSDEVAQNEVKRYCVKSQKEMVAESREGINEKYGSNTKEVFRRKLPQEFGFQFSDEEIQRYKEDGFIEFCSTKNTYFLRSEDQLKKLLKIYELEESFLTSEKMQNLLIERVESVLEKYNAAKPDLYHRNSSIYEVGSLITAPYFPTERLRSSEAQEKINQWFELALQEIKIENGQIVWSHVGARQQTAESPEEYLERARQQSISQLERIFEFEKRLGVSTTSLQKPSSHDLLEKYLEIYFEDTKLSRINIEVDQIERAGFFRETLNERAQAIYLKMLQTATNQNIESGLTKISDLSKKFALTEPFLDSPEVTAAKVQAFEAAVASGGRVLRTFLLNVSIPSEILHSETFTKRKQQLVLDNLANENLAQGVLKTIIDKLDFSNCPEFFESEELEMYLTAFVRAKMQSFIVALQKNPYDALDFARTDTGIAAKYSRNSTPETPALFNAKQITETLQHQELIEQLFIEEFAKKITEKLFEEQGVGSLRGLEARAKELQKLFDIDPSAISEITFQVLLKNADKVFRSKGDFEVFILSARNIEKLQKEFNLSDIQTQHLAVKAFNFFIMHSDAPMSSYISWDINASENYTTQLYEQFGLTPEEAHDGAMTLYTFWMNRGADARAAEIKKSSHLMLICQNMIKERKTKTNAHC